jgi:hypothetical protein
MSPNGLAEANLYERILVIVVAIQPVGDCHRSAVNPGGGRGFSATHDGTTSSLCAEHQPMNEHNRLNVRAAVLRNARRYAPRRPQK